MRATHADIGVHKALALGTDQVGRHHLRQPPRRSVRRSHRPRAPPSRSNSQGRGRRIKRGANTHHCHRGARSEEARYPINIGSLFAVGVDDSLALPHAPQDIRSLTPWEVERAAQVLAGIAQLHLILVLAPVPPTRPRALSGEDCRFGMFIYFGMSGAYDGAVCRTWPGEHNKSNCSIPWSEYGGEVGAFNPKALMPTR